MAPALHVGNAPARSADTVRVAGQDDAAPRPGPGVSSSRGAEGPRGRFGWRSCFRRLRYLPVIATLLMCGGVIGLYFQPPGLKVIMRAFHLEPGAGTDNPIAVAVERPAFAGADPDDSVFAPDFTGRIVGLGTLLPRRDVTAVALPFGAGDARIARLDVEEGDRVARGDILAVLDSEPLYRATIGAAQARLAMREAALEQRRASIGAGTDEARAETTVAIRRLETARAELARARADLERAYVRAPTTGTVLDVHVRPGERPGSAGVMTIGAISDVTAEIEVHQTQIGAVSRGDRVAIVSPTLPVTLNGTVARIGLEIARQSLIDDDPAAAADGRVVKVTVHLDPEAADVAAHHVNLQVVAHIAVQDGPRPDYGSPGTP